MSQRIAKNACTFLAAACLAAALASPALAGKPGGGGDTPPPSPEGPTPVSACGQLTAPGAYVLTNDLEEQTGSDCLVIQADNVDLDLAGFTITGTNGHGVVTPDLTLRANVRNGVIAGFTRGVLLGGGQVEHLRVLDSVYGIVLSNAKGIVDAVEVEAERGAVSVRSGIVSNSHLVITAPDEASTIALNCGFACVATNNIVEGISDTPSIGILAAVGSVLTGNAVSKFQLGIYVACPSVLRENAAIQNTIDVSRHQAAGFAQPCVLTGNVAPVLQ